MKTTINETDDIVRIDALRGYNLNRVPLFFIDFFSKKALIDLISVNAFFYVLTVFLYF